MSEKEDNEIKDRGLKENAEKTVHFLQKAAEPIGSMLTFVLPRVIKVVAKAYELYCKLPQNAIKFLIGFIFCFFGGLYPVVFAAVQAAEHAGRQALVNSIKIIANEAMIILEESKKDDEVDADGDGIADVKQISGGEYMKRKTALVLRKMNPQKIDDAIYSMYKVWLSVAAVLSVQFAKTISLSLAISEFLKKPCDRFIAPLLQLAIPDEYDKWVPVVLGWICKSMAMSIAWYIQSVLSAFSSALAGGLLMATAFYDALMIRGITVGGRIIKDTDKAKSWFIDINSTLFAGLGFYFQYKLNFDVPYPYNLFLAPIEIAEYYMRWTITK